MLRWLVAGFIAVVALASVWSAAVLAQTAAPTTSTTGTTSTATGAFDSLSPGNQKIARALYDAQTTGSGGTSTPLTLDEIAAKKQDGQGWGKVFQDMKSQGLVQEKNLGQVVSRSQRSTHGGAYTASGREFGNGSRGHGAKALDDNGANKRGRYDTGSSGRGHTYASGSDHSGSSYSGPGRSGGTSGHGGRGSK